MGYLLVSSLFNENGSPIIHVFMTFVFVVCSWRSPTDPHTAEWSTDWTGRSDSDPVQAPQLQPDRSLLK